MSGKDSILISVARAHSQNFVAGTIQSQWEYFEYSVKLALARWTALRMAVEGEWGGGDTARKYEILLEEIFNLFKYNRTIHADDLAMNIDEYVESEFGLVCEDGSTRELSELMVVLADECKVGQFERVKDMHDQLQSLFPIDLKQAKLRNQFDQTSMADAASAADAQMDQGDEQEEEEEAADPDGWATVRRSTRKRAAPKFYDPAVQFPGAQ